MTQTTVLPEVLSMRERLIRQATILIGAEGWSAVTMGRLARASGVSRQTVYNEIGTKEALAEAVVLHELAGFLEQVEHDLTGAHDVVTAIRRAALGVLVSARDNPLLRSILAASHGGGEELLPLLTTQAGVLIETAKSAIRPHVLAFDIDLPADRIETCIDMVVRLILSHVMQPGDDPEATADGVAWIAAQILV